MCCRKCTWLRKTTCLAYRAEPPEFISAAIKMSADQTTLLDSDLRQQLSLIFASREEVLGELDPLLALFQLQSNPSALRLWKQYCAWMVNF